VLAPIRKSALESLCRRQTTAPWSLPQLVFSFCVIALISLPACSSDEHVPFVSLGAEARTDPSPEARGGPQLRIAVAPIMSAQTSATAYGPLLEYLEQKVRRETVLIQRRAYAEINEIVRIGGAEIAFVCSGAYAEGNRNFGMELLVAPVVAGNTTYRSYIIARKDLGASALSELRGKRFAFTDILSNTGFLYPSFLLKRMNEEPAGFFLKTIFTHSHDASIRALAKQLVDGAAVDSIVYEEVARREPQLVEGLDIISESDPFGIPPVVVSPGLDGKFKERLRAVFLRMADDPAAAPALDALGVGGFVIMTDRAYDSVRRMASVLHGGADPNG
jgi:phosphonate transport system substrate-binding protein